MKQGTPFTTLIIHRFTCLFYTWIKFILISILIPSSCSWHIHQWIGDSFLQSRAFPTGHERVIHIPVRRSEFECSPGKAQRHTAQEAAHAANGAVHTRYNSETGLPSSFLSYPPVRDPRAVMGPDPAGKGCCDRNSSIHATIYFYFFFFFFLSLPSLPFNGAVALLLLL